ncbi:dual specificity protein kinase TTK isoform X2 [Ambystoma mexicanum]|uniref:dual specificity protein kinase TTK isoform X2 n=1 Tax=Ambystoma mexicanum TaxID=8296 RepID=UPI0037E8243C
MEEEDMSERRLKLASIMDRVRSLKTKYTEENLTDEMNLSGCPGDKTDHSESINHLMMMGNKPEEWWNFLLKAEKKGDSSGEPDLHNKLMTLYSRAVTVLPSEEHSSNESFARIHVRFAELKVDLSPEEARDQFQIARMNCKMFAFVHVMFAQFELSQGNFKKSKQILQKAVECRAVPMEMLEKAMQNLYLKKMTLLVEDQDNDNDKDNVSVKPLSSLHDSSHNRTTSCSRVRKESAGSGELSVNVNSSKSSSLETFDVVDQNNLLPPSNKMHQFGRVPLESCISPPERNTTNNDVPNINLRQSGSACMSATVSSLIPRSDGDDDSYNLANVKFGKDSMDVEYKFSMQDKSEDVPDSTLTLLNKTDSSATVKGRGPEMMYHELHNPIPHEQVNNRLHESASHVLPSHGSERQQQCKRSPVETEWKVPDSSCHRNTVEAKRNGYEASGSKRTTPPGAAPNKSGPPYVCETPNSNNQNTIMSCFRTPVVNECIPPMPQNCTPYSQSSAYQHSNLHTPAPPLQIKGPFQVTTPHTTNECTIIKGKVYSILRQIGTGGSSKVFQMMDDKKRLYAVKYVNLEDADQLTIEGYKNEIEHLIKLQPHSDKIIRLYDYEITDNCIRMVMECGNIDLNSWLKKKKNISPWERKSYWKNMLEAVHAIHQHGIVHSDLKPANFLIVDGMLKLIDFGIANQLQPDVTSIVKDSQVGTVNYMPPEAIQDTSTEENGKTRSKISPKSDVWSLGCILYYMTYGKTPFQHITNQITKLHAIIDSSYEIEFPPIPEMGLQDVLKKCLVRNPKQRISIAELLVHPYVQIQPSAEEHLSRRPSEDVKWILGQLISLNSPNSISRAARTLYEQFDTGRSLDTTAFAKPGGQIPWTMK